MAAEACQLGKQVGEAVCGTWPVGPRGRGLTWAGPGGGRACSQRSSSLVSQASREWPFRRQALRPSSRSRRAARGSSRAAKPRQASSLNCRDTSVMCAHASPAGVRGTAAYRGGTGSGSPHGGSWCSCPRALGRRPVSTGAPTSRPREARSRAPAPTAHLLRLPRGPQRLQGRQTFKHVLVWGQDRAMRAVGEGASDTTQCQGLPYPLARALTVPSLACPCPSPAGIT